MVESDYAHMLCKFDCQRHANITKTNNGQTSFSGKKLIMQFLIFLLNTHYPPQGRRRPELSPVFPETRELSVFRLRICRTFALKTRRNLGGLTFPGGKYTPILFFCQLPEGAIVIVYWFVSPSSAAFLIASALVVTPSLR